jgi:two-component system sensor histidine kinase MprB
MELNWVEHYRYGPDGAGGPVPPPSPPWPTGPADEGTDDLARTDGWAEAPDNLPEETGEQNSPEQQEAGRGRRQAGTARRSLAWLRQISFRGRVSALVAAAVGLAVAMAALSSYVAISRQMESQASANLQAAVQDAQDPSNIHIYNSIFGPTLDLGPFVRLQLQTGYEVQVILNTNSGVQTYALPLSDHVARGNPQMVQWSFFKLTPKDRATFASPSGTESVQNLTGADQNRYRVATVSIFKGTLAVMIGYPLSNIDTNLTFLRIMLILVAVGGVALAAALGWVVGRASMRPVEDLTLAAERVAKTQDLSQKIEDTSNDELGRLARSFNAMLAALAASKQQQAQLVSDAGHELRTPLTSLRTNIEVLMRNKDLPPTDRDELLSDVDAQLQELATLVADLVDLARDEEKQEAEPELVAFDQLVRHALERAQRRAMSVNFEASLEPGYVRTQPALLERAVINVLDNAAKWSPAGGQVKVRLWAEDSSWHLVVADQGPGIPAEDLPHIFERFYRAASARSMPGSGLGLAIVKRAVTTHGGTIDVTCPPEGGTKVELVLPYEQEQAGGDGSASDSAVGAPEAPAESFATSR